ncbi:MAG: dihydroorotase [Bacteroidetes bacterium]|nr:dihydroorotase [Bacteroidota bacterium]
MKQQLLIKNATIVNEGKAFSSDIFIENGIINTIAPNIRKVVSDTIDAAGLYLFPGIIDPHVHFREPGLTYKADIHTESAAAIAGGVTSYMDMPNTIPNATNKTELAKKYELAANTSFANFGFYFGATSDNLDEITSLDANECCAVTDDGLYFTNKESLLVEQPDVLRKILRVSPKLVAIHSELESVVNDNLEKAIAKYGDNMPVHMHAHIRSEDACYKATKLATEIAGESGNHLHILHVSTAKELDLFESYKDITKKKITSEVCIHHLYFSEEDYDHLGARIKWNPSVKSYADKIGLLDGLRNYQVDIVSTDHAPHLLSEKEQHYTKSPGGGPMIQHSLVAMLEFVKTEKLSLERIAEVMCHNVAELYKIDGRGYIREGYYADITLVDLDEKWQVQKSNILSKCGWSAFEGRYFSSKIKYTIVNGNIAYKDGRIISEPCGVRLRHKL